MFSRCLDFCRDFLAIQKSCLIRKIKLVSKLMTSQPGKQTIAIHILPNISISKGYQRMKFYQLIEYNMTNIFLGKSCQDVAEKLFQDHFLENQNWEYLRINSLKVYTVCFYSTTTWGLSKGIQTKLQTICFFLLLLFFWN